MTSSYLRSNQSLKVNSESPISLKEMLLDCKKETEENIQHSSTEKKLLLVKGTMGFIRK